MIRALGIDTSATHMEWFFGPKGLKVSEIGARPPASGSGTSTASATTSISTASGRGAIVYGRVEARRLAPPRHRLGPGPPDRDGKIAGYDGSHEVSPRVRHGSGSTELPRPGTRTAPISKGYLANAWFRLRHRTTTSCCEMMEFVGRTLRVRARPA